MSVRPIIERDGMQARSVAHVNDLKSHMMDEWEVAMQMPEPSPLTNRHPCPRRLLFRRRMVPLLTQLPSQGACPRGGRTRLLAPVLGLAMLTLSVVYGTPPAVAQAAPTEAAQVLSEAQVQERRERIRRFFQERLHRRQIVATTVTPSGQTIDWIRPVSQTPDGILAQPPEDATPDADPGITTLPQSKPPAAATQMEGRAQTEVQLYPSVRGPAGTVPVVRFDVEKYLASVKVPPDDPREIFMKKRPPTTLRSRSKELPPPAPESNDRYYVNWRTYRTNYGSAGYINIWDVYGPVPTNETSIAQALVSGGTPVQTVEAGKIELQTLNGDTNPHFFTWYTTNDYAQGDWVGGYNALYDGWIQVSSSVAPGMSLAPWRSFPGGSQYTLDVEVRLDQGDWWVKAAGQWVGYYPYCKSGDAKPCDQGTLFSANGIRDSASKFDWYGEVYDISAPAPTSTDMGSGKFASAGYSQAAYFRNLQYYDSPETSTYLSSGSLDVTDADCYSGNGPFYGTSAGWRNWFYYGGPGKQASGCN
jgi:Neprosin